MELVKDFSVRLDTRPLDAGVTVSQPVVVVTINGREYGFTPEQARLLARRLAE